MCNENQTSARARGKLSELKKEGVVTREALALHKHPQAQSLPGMLTEGRPSWKWILSPDQL